MCVTAFHSIYFRFIVHAALVVFSRNLVMQITWQCRRIISDFTNAFLSIWKKLLIPSINSFICRLVWVLRYSFAKYNWRTLRFYPIHKGLTFINKKSSFHSFYLSHNMPKAILKTRHSYFANDYRFSTLTSKHSYKKKICQNWNIYIIYL